MRWSHAVVGLSTEGILGDLSGTPEEEDVTDDGIVVADPLCDVSPPRSAEGVRRDGGRNILPSAGGQQKWFGERVVAVVVGGLRLVSV